MKVILIEDVQGAGKKGQTIEAKDGFARNFLLPRGLAIAATEANVNRSEQIMKNLASRKEKALKTAEEIKEKLEEITVTIKKKTGVEGKLFGSVTPKEIADAIAALIPVTIDKKLVKIGEHIKMTGAYTVEIHLAEGVHANVKVEVEKVD